MRVQVRVQVERFRVQVKSLQPQGGSRNHHKRVQVKQVFSLLLLMLPPMCENRVRRGKRGGYQKSMYITCITYIPATSRGLWGRSRRLRRIRKHR